jgi:hypothetical protein
MYSVRHRESSIETEAKQVVRKEQKESKASKIERKEEIMEDVE